MDQGHYQEVVSAQVALNSTGDKFTYTPSRPCRLIRWGFLADALVDVGAGAIVAMDRRVLTNDDTGRVDGAGGTISTGTTDVAKGFSLYHECSPPLDLNFGDQLVFEVTNAADTAGTGIVFLHVQPDPFVGTEIAEATKVAS